MTKRSDTPAKQALPLAENMFPALERLALGASSEILLSFRIFDPATELRSDEARALDLQTWADLLVHKARDGIQLRILLTDFEPILTPDLHQMAWENTAGLLAIKKTVPEADFQIICAQHDARFSRAVEWIFWPMFLQKLWKASRAIQAHELDLEYLPGLSRYLGEGGKPEWKTLLSPTAMHPVTHHQKFAVFDGEVAIVGGLDVDERRYDDKFHKRPASDTWQDLSVQVSAPEAAHLRAQFIDWWNTDYGRSAPRERLERLAYACGVDAPEASAMAQGQTKVARPDDETSADIVVTRTKHQSGFWVLRPKPEELSIRDRTLEMISSAETCVYIETQFLRHRPVAKALADAAISNPDLQAIIVLPFAPEEVAFQKQRNGAHRLGEHLQVQCLDQIQAAFGARCGIYGLVKRDVAGDGANGRASAYGSGVIHVHSKVLIVDDAQYSVSSANLNGRSLVWDTEIGIAGENTDFAYRLRRQLWGLHSGSDDFAAMALEEASEAWARLAHTNAKAKPQERAGFIVPYKKMPARRFGAPTFYIPEDMV